MLCQLSTYCLSVNSPIFARHCDTGAGLYKYLSFARGTNLVTSVDGAKRDSAKGSAYSSDLGAFLFVLMPVGSFLVRVTSIPADGFTASVTSILMAAPLQILLVP